MDKKYKKKLADINRTDADKHRLLQAEKLLKEYGYVYDDKKGGWVKKK